jgi:hypothetical protein
MTDIVLLTAVLAFLVVAARLTGLVMSDGLGSVPPPRSHRDELGSWIDRELQR